MSVNASDLRPLTLFLFVFAGYYKASLIFAVVPLDLTLLFAGATLLLCFWLLYKHRSFPIGSLLVTGLFIAFLVGLRWPTDLAEYPTQKTLRLFSLTALAAFAPLVLIRRDRDCLVFTAAVACLGVLMAGFALLEVATAGVANRVSIWNVNPILVARASGFAVLFFLIAYWFGRLSAWQAILPFAIAQLGLLLSGSRGPLVALIVAIGLSAFTLKKGSKQARRALQTIVLTVAATLAALLWLSFSGSNAGRRISRLFSGNWGDTELTRITLWKEAVAIIPDNPLGLGWGGFSAAVQVFHDGRKLALYPHNVFLEIFVEGGWLAGMFFACLVCWTLLSTLKRVSRRDGLEWYLVLVSLMYWLACAFVSGDVNDNRPFWAFLALSLSISIRLRIEDQAAQLERPFKADERRS